MSSASRVRQGDQPLMSGLQSFQYISQINTRIESRESKVASRSARDIQCWSRLLIVISSRPLEPPGSRLRLLVVDLSGSLLVVNRENGVVEHSVVPAHFVSAYYSFLEFNHKWRMKDVRSPWIYARDLMLRSPAVLVLPILQCQP